MLTSRAFTISTLLLVTVSVVCYISLPASANRRSLTLATKHHMSTQSVNLIKSVSLLAKEEKLPPLGVPQEPNRDIGFASVFIRLENPQAKKANLFLKKIEICDTSTGKIIMVSQQPQEIRLHPLENSENAFHLKNKTGYGEHSKVKAVITYEVDFQTHTIESAPVEIERL